MLKKEERKAEINNKSRELLTNIWKNDLFYLKNKYSNCALVIIPELREIN